MNLHECSRAMLPVLLSIFAGCGSDTVTSKCDAGQVPSGDTCVVLCQHDSDCSLSEICEVGICAAGIRPEVTGHIPDNLATDIAVDSDIIVVFSVPMDTLITGSSVLVTGGGAAVAGDISWNDAALTLTFAPTANLHIGETYRVQIGTSARSEAGMPMNTGFDFEFTVVLPDTPIVVAHSPRGGALDADRDTKLISNFSVPMDTQATSAALRVTDQYLVQVAGEKTWDSGNLSLSFTPNSPLVPGGTYTYGFSTAARSADGVHLETPFSAQFTVYLPPVGILATTPIPGSVDVGVTPLITVEFSVPMDAVSVGNSMSVFIEGLAATVQGETRLNGTGLLATFTPGNDLAYGTSYRIDVAAGVKSAENATLSTAHSATFHTLTTPDTNAPTVTITAMDAGITAISTPDLDQYESFLFTGTVTDPEGNLDRVEAQVVPAAVAVSAQDWLPATDASGQWDFRWYALSTPAGPPNGPTKLYVRAIDKGGNSSEVEYLFHVDFVYPATPTIEGTVPTSWKFETINISLASEASSRIRVLVNDQEIAGSPFLAGVSGALNVTVPLAGIGTPSIIAIFAADEEGNENPQAVSTTVNRIAYDCLTALNDFPSVGAGTPVTFSDDQMGNVSVSYRLNATIAGDTYIRDGSSITRGTEDTMRISSVRHILMKFSSGLLPPGCSQITSAIWSLNGYVGQVSVEPVQRNWVEDEATWTRPTSSSYWNTQGGDVGDTLGDHSTNGINFSIIATRWKNARDGASPSEPNFGLILRGTTSTSKYVDSVDSPNVTNRPTLTFTVREPD